MNLQRPKSSIGALSRRSLKHLRVREKAHIHEGDAIAAARRSALLEFSPDGHYLVAFPCDLTGSFAWDLRQNGKAVLTGKLRDLNFFYFAFLSSGRVVISDVEFLSDVYNRVTGIDEATIEAIVQTFPSGKVLSVSKIPPGRLFPAADPEFVIVRPLLSPFPLPPPCGWRTTEHGDSGSSGAIDVSNGQAIVSRFPSGMCSGTTMLRTSQTGT
jgi:hypothetical protein